jgi:predicted metal-dependent hydrolase
MDKRWGSLSPNGQLTLNLSLIRAPKDCIEYVVIHELCHLIEHNHGPEFYKLLDQTMPDWMKRKHKLELSLI